MTLRQVGEAIGADPSYVSRLERGDIATPSDDLLRNLAAALNRPKAEVYVAAGRLTPELASRIEQGMPLAVQQFGRLLTVAENELDHTLAELGDQPISAVATPADIATMAKITEAMNHVAEMVQALSNGDLSQDQFEHITEIIRRLKLSHLSTSKKTP